MTSQRFGHRSLRQRTVPARGPLNQTVFSLRRFLSRVSPADAAAVLLIWGNILGLLAYPALGHHLTSKKDSPQTPVNEPVERDA